MKKLNVAKCVLGFLLVLSFTLPGIALANDIVAEIINEGNTLVFEPVTEFKELILTVTGPCDFQYRQVIEKGVAFFRLDETTIDGTYRFNIFRVEEVDASVVKLLKEARKKANAEVPKQLCREGRLPQAPLTQADGFHVIDGKIIYDPTAFEKAAGSDFDLPLDAASLAAIKPAAAPVGISRAPTKDFVILDDLIVDGSACIGFDCVNGESFGFDTIRLKENNLRIKFDDTSTAASFPRTDWQLTANASANGGASKFSIDDISGGRTPFTVEANARSHSLYVDDGGRIGNRTSTPSTEIHTIDGDTPTLRLQQDGSSGFAPQTWDVAGNETNFFIRDVSNGSQLPLRIRPGAPTDSFFVDVNGNVGLGTASPDFDLDIDNGTSSSANFVVRGTSGAMILQDQDAPADEQVIQHLASGGTYRFRGLNDALAAETVEGIVLDLGTGNVGIHRTTADASHPLIVGTGGSDGNGAHLTAGGMWTMGSSREFKEAITAVTAAEAFGVLAELSPVRYRYKLEPEEEYVGFIAEDVPDLVATASRKYLTAMDIVGVLTKVVQEQQGAFNAQRSLVEDQNQLIRDLAARVAELESHME